MQTRQNSRLQEMTALRSELAREALRTRESLILAAAQEPGADSLTIALAEQIRDHRGAGHYTTQG